MLTVETMRWHISTLLNKAEADGLIRRNPLKDTKIRNLGKDAPRRDSLTAADVKKLLNNAPTTWRDMVLLCLNIFGQRLGDIACLRWDAMDFAKNTVSMTTQKTKNAMT